MPILPTLRLALVLVGLSACERPRAAAASSGSDAGDDARRGWVEVSASPDPDNGEALVRVAVDTLGARALADGGYLVWVETRHARHRREGGRPFDRELLRFVLRCAAPDDGAFRRVSVTLLDGERPPVYQEALSVDAAQATPWRLARAGTADLAAFTRACALVAPQSLSGAGLPPGGGPTSR
jgi:hypothetical protein